MARTRVSRTSTSDSIGLSEASSKLISASCSPAGRPAARPDSEPSIATWIRAFTVVTASTTRLPDLQSDRLSDFDQFDGFAARAFYHQGAGIPERVDLLEEF